VEDKIIREGKNKNGIKIDKVWNDVIIVLNYIFK
jgi:hypothetical protein